jgi:uncharacterized protein (TIGR02266 family)
MDQFDAMQVSEEEQARLDELEAERRRAERLSLSASVSVASADNFITGFSENLSEGGIFIATFSPPAVGERVKLAISVEGSKEIECVGVVRWLRREESGGYSGCGLQFEALEPAAARALTRMMRQLRKEPLLGDF